MRLLRLGLAFLATCLAGIHDEARSQAAVTLPCELEAGPLRSVARVIDGETLALDDGKTVRLIGALAPHIRDAGPDVSSVSAEWPPAKEAKTTLDGLAQGKTVALAFAGPRVNRYGYVLAHLFLKAPDGDIWLQGRMLELGQARAYALREHDACLAAMLGREAEARRAGRGLWRHAAYQVRPADRPTELARYAATFQVVRGRVERARRARGLAFLDLTSNERPPAGANGRQRGAFRVVWPYARGRGTGIGDPAGLVGANVLVRGWITVRMGPQIEMDAANELVREASPESGKK